MRKVRTVLSSSTYFQIVVHQNALKCIWFHKLAYRWHLRHVVLTLEARHAYPAKFDSAVTVVYRWARTSFAISSSDLMISHRLFWWSSSRTTRLNHSVESKFYPRSRTSYKHQSYHPCLIILLTRPHSSKNPCLNNILHLLLRSSFFFCPLLTWNLWSISSLLTLFALHFISKLLKALVKSNPASGLTACVRPSVGRNLSGIGASSADSAIDLRGLCAPSRIASRLFDSAGEALNLLFGSLLGFSNAL